MKNHTTVTVKGQITLPIQLRQAIGLEPGDTAAVSLLDERTIAVRLPLDIAKIRQKVGKPSHKQPLTNKEKERLQARGLS